MKLGKPVTVTLKASDHYGIGRQPLFKEGEKIKLAKHLWERSQRTKNRRMVYRMLKKEYWPFATINKVNDNEADFETTITLTPFKF